MSCTMIDCRLRRHHTHHRMRSHTRQLQVSILVSAYLIVPIVYVAVTSLALGMPVEDLVVGNS